MKCKCIQKQSFLLAIGAIFIRSLLCFLFSVKISMNLDSFNIYIGIHMIVLKKKFHFLSIPPH